MSIWYELTKESAPCYSKQLNEESSTWDWGQSGIKFGKKIVYTKSQQLFRRTRISMLTGLKVPSLTHKCVFYKPVPEQIWIWIFQVFKYKNEIVAQRVDEKLGSSGENV